MDKITVTDAAIQAFSDEMDRQREKNGWPRFQRQPVEEWPMTEREAARSCLAAAVARMEVFHG